MQERVRIEVDARGVADVCMVRADKMNALDFAMFDALAAAITQIKADPQVRAVVLHGQGKAFCAGLDTSRFAMMGAGDAGGVRDLMARTHGRSNSPQFLGMGWRELAVPVIAAVHGVAFGGGLQLALGADIRLVTADTKLSVLEIKWGLVPDMAGIVLMRGLLRDDVVRELTFTGRIVRGDEAVAIGLATRVCLDPLADALALAAEIAGRNPDALRLAQDLLNRAPDEDAASLLLAESKAQTELMGSANQTEAVRANLAQRPPVFVLG